MLMMQDHTVSPIRSIHSLRDTDSDLATLVDSLVGPGWTLVQHETYDGHLLILLCGQDEESWFCLHGSAKGVHLGRLLDDNFDELGCYETIAAALNAVSESLAVLEHDLVA